MYPQSVLSKNKKNVTFFLQKITIFTAMKYCSILHGHVCIMSLGDNWNLEQVGIVTHGTGDPDN